MTVTATLIAPAGVQSFEARSGNQYTVTTTNNVGTITVVLNDILDALNAGFILTSLPAGLQTLFGSGGSSFAEAGILTRYQSITGVGNTNDTTEDTLFTFALPANAFDIAGRTLQITAAGSLATNAHSKTAKLYFGSSIVATTGAQTGFYSPIVGTTHGGISLPIAGTETDTAAITIKVTGQTGTAAANDVVLNSLIIEALN
jgi:hypothetical protein